MAPKRRMMRPAAQVGRLVRPAAAGVPRRSRSKKFGDLSFPEIGALGMIKLEEATYYHRPVEVAGEVKGIKLEGAEAYVELQVTGTRSEELLRALGDGKENPIWVHICPNGCPGELSGELLVHAPKYNKIVKTADPWYSNVEKVVPDVEGERDELARLREEAARREIEARGAGRSPEEVAKEEKRRKKEAKEKEKEKEKRGDRSPKKETRLERGQKDLEVLFQGTGLDPLPDRRKKVLKKAKKIGENKKKKKKKDSSEKSKGSGGSSSSSSSSGEVAAGIFSQEKKIKQVATRCPGALACSALLEAREHLLTAQGTTWAMDKEALQPIFNQYVRASTSFVGAGPALLQEATTVACCLDALLQGKVALSCDYLAQRLKALENSARGGHWTVSRQHELIRADNMQLAEEEENLAAAKRAREEDRLRASLARPYGGREAEGSGGYQGKRGKGWKGQGGKYKGRSDENGRGKGGDGRKDERGGQWQGNKEKR